MNTAPAQAPNPLPIFEALTAYQKSFALKGAIDLDLFTAIAEGAHTIAEIARRCLASSRGVRILCDYLVIGGLLNKNGDRYDLTPEAALFLNRNSHAYMGSAANFLLHEDFSAAYSDMATTIRTGRTLLEGDGTVSEENGVWIDFARGMAPMAAPAATEIATRIVPETGAAPKRVLDLAAGHGMFGIAIAREWPDAEIVACDWDAVLSVAEENAARAGVSERISKLAGDALQMDLGSGYDLVLITNFLHHFDTATNQDLLRKVRQSLADGGRVITLEFVPNEDRVTPPTAAAFSLVMLASTRAGDAYTFAELESMFRNAGFARSEFVPLQMSPQQVVVSYSK